MKLKNQKDAIDFQIAVANKYIQLRASAAKRNKEFTLTLTSVVAFSCLQYVTDTGVALDWRKNQITVDRKDSTKGYVKGNVVACSRRFNDIKGCLTKDDVIELYKHVDKLI